MRKMAYKAEHAVDLDSDIVVATPIMATTWMSLRYSIRSISLARTSTLRVPVASRLMSLRTRATSAPRVFARSRVKIIFRWSPRRRASALLRRPMILGKR